MTLPKAEASWPAAEIPRHPTAEALVEATERLLIEDGYAELSTRRIVEAAGQTHGSIRYHFGSLEALIVAVVERSTIGITERQRAMYQSDLPFRAKWEQAMEWFEEDLAAGYPKLLAELFAAAWNVPRCRAGLRRTMEIWAEVLEEAVAGAAEEYGVDADDDLVAGVAGLIGASQQGLLFQRLAGIDVEHEATVAVVGRAIDLLEERGAQR